MLAALTTPAASQAPKEDGFQTAAPYAILIEADSGTVLFEKNADQPIYPSSMAKLMTAEVVFQAVQEGKLKLDDEATISENAWRKGGAPSGGSTMYAALNSRVKVHDLIRSVVDPVGQRRLHRIGGGAVRHRAAVQYPDEQTRQGAWPY